MNKPLCVQNIGKSYKTYKSEAQRFARWFGAPVTPSEEHWILKDVSFEVAPGEALGIIGQNGAGKSTLLKVISNTLKPTKGRIHIDGNIASILELGMGFNPELTGRQNAIQVLGMMGFSSEEIRQAIPEIEKFSEVGEYFDEPIRVYSSGMQVRVAFSVATAYRPEVLVVDEAFSVGDAYFQHKSFSRIREFQKMGTTLLIVSHDRSAIQSLCNRALLLDRGSIIKDGSPEEVFDFYNAIIAEKGSGSIEVRKVGNRTKTSSGTGEARVKSIVLYNAKGQPTETVEVGELVELRIRVKVYKTVESLVFGYGIKDRLGQIMYGTNTWHTGQAVNYPKAGSEYTFRIVFPANFGVGSYSIQTALVDRDTHLTSNYEWIDLAQVFSVVNVNKAQFVGCLWNDPVISVERYSP